MTDDEIVSYYANLLIKQYASKPKALAHVAMLARMAIMNQLPTSVMNAYDIDTAVGVQLDVLGKYVGIARTGYNFSGYVSLSDESYRQILKIKIIQNNYGSSLADIQNFIFLFFNGQMRIFDYLDMRIGYFLDEDFGDIELAEFIIMQNLLPRPMGVQLSATIYGPTLDFFSFRTYANETTGFGFNSYEVYDEGWTFLDYNDALIA